MQVQSINVFNFNKTNSVQKKSHTEPAFKSYDVAIEQAVKRDLPYTISVSAVFENLYKELKKTSGVKLAPELSLLEKFRFYNIADFMEKISAPIAKVPSELRDLVFKAEDESINLMEHDPIGSLTMFNFGKKGFFSDIFNSQDARSDIKFVFHSGFGDSFEVGVTKKGGLDVEQISYPNWIKSEFGIIDRRKCKSGTYDTSTPIIW